MQFFGSYVEAVNDKMVAVPLPLLLLVFGSCITLQGSTTVASNATSTSTATLTSTYTSQTQTDVTTSQTYETTTKTDTTDKTTLTTPTDKPTTSTDSTITSTDVTATSPNKTPTSTKIITNSTENITLSTDKIASSTENQTTSTYITPTSPQNMTTSTYSASTNFTAMSTDSTPSTAAADWTETSTNKTNTTNSINTTFSAVYAESTSPTERIDNTSTSYSAATFTPQYTVSNSPTTQTNSTTLAANTDTTTPYTNNSLSTPLTGNTTLSTPADNTSATTYTGNTNPATPTSASYTDATVPVTNTDNTTTAASQSVITTATAIASTISSFSSDVTEPERTPTTTRNVTILTPTSSTGRPSGDTTLRASSQSGDTLTSGQRTAIIVFVCMVVVIALITMAIVIIGWKRRHKATITEAVDLRSIVNHRSNNARISLHDAVLDDDPEAETDSTAVGKPSSGDDSENSPHYTDPSPIIRNKSFPSTSFDNPTYRSDVIDRTLSFTSFKGNDSQDGRSSSASAKGNKTRCRHSSADDIISKSLKKSRLSMTSVASLAHSLSLIGSEYFVLEEEVDKMSFAGAKGCDPPKSASNGEVAEAEDDTNDHAENAEGTNATFYMQ